MSWPEAAFCIALCIGLTTCAIVTKVTDSQVAVAEAYSMNKGAR